MISVIINKQKYNVPTSWDDVTYSQWLNTLNETDTLKLASFITDIPLNYLEALSDFQLNKIGYLLNFLKTEIDGNCQIDVVDIRLDEWGKKIELQQLVEKNKDNLLPFLKNIVKIYIQNDNDSIVYVYKMAFNLLDQLKKILEIESEQLHVRPTSEQINAGLDMFDEFGVMNTIKAVALGNILNFDNVLKIKYNVVFLFLKMSKTETIYQENYRKLLNANR